MGKGIIYRLTSPDGKIYIGQTIQPFNNRIYGHNNDAYTNTKYYERPLYKSIREFGMDNFKKEIIVECNDYELDFYEITFVMEENTLQPNGLNTKPGGSFIYSKFDELPEELQIFYSQNARKHTNYNLPPGLVEINLPDRNGGKGEFGFKVILNEVTHTFISSHQSMEDKLRDAMECYKTIKEGRYYRRANSHKWDKEIVEGFDVPEGVKYRKDKDGWEVHVKVNGITYRKTYTKKKFTIQQNLQSAVNHLNFLKGQPIIRP